jgi:hypothetical protein
MDPMRLRWRWIHLAFTLTLLAIFIFSRLPPRSLIATDTNSPFVKDLWRDEGKDQYMLYTEEKLRELSVCHATQTCGPNQLKVSC